MQTGRRNNTTSFGSVKVYVVEKSRLGVVLCYGTTVPTDATAGFAPGCIFQDIDGTAGFTFYVNRGSNTSCSFKSIDTGGLNLSALTATASELNTLHAQTITSSAGAGITGGTGTVYANSVQQNGSIFTTRILLDLTGLGSSTTDLDIIGQGASPAYIGQLTTLQNGTILAGKMECLEVPTGGVTDIDLYWASEGTGKFDDGIAALTETALITSGGAWTLALTKAIADPVGIASGYLYLTCGAAGTAATYTAGKFLLTLYGY